MKQTSFILSKTIASMISPKILSKGLLIERGVSSFSKGLFFLLFLSILMPSCDLFRKAETTAPKKEPKKEKPEPTNNNNNNTASTAVVDTVKWKVDPKAKPPITNNTPAPNTGAGAGTNPNTNPSKPTGPTPVTKQSYTLSYLLPFNSDKFSESSGVIPPKGQFAIDFYAGAKLALDSVSNLPMNLTVNVMDSKTDFNAISTRFEVSKADVIIGPVEKESVVSAIGFSTRNNVTVVSPYFPTGDVDGSNPNFVQIKPSLKTHCTNIARHIQTHYPNAQVVLAARSKENESSRFAYFDEANKMYSKSKYEEWKIEDDINFNIEPYIENVGTTVFILPSWNEAFVSSFLKKLNASPRRGQVAVYGMPQWMDFDKGLLPFYEALKVRVSSSTYIDAASADVKNFRNRFYARYKKLPNSDAYLGYDCTLYVGKMLYQYGPKFPYFLDREQEAVLHTKFYFNPIYKAINTGDDVNNNVSKYENSYVNILKYQANAFRLDD